MGHPQPPTPMNTDNQTATGILNGTIKQKRSKAIDMRFYWLKDRAEQGQFDIKWVPGKYNLADYFTKHHPGSRHRKVRPIYLYEEGKSPSTMQGCIGILTGESGKILSARARAHAQKSRHFMSHYGHRHSREIPSLLASLQERAHSLAVRMSHLSQ